MSKTVYIPDKRNYKLAHRPETPEERFEAAAQAEGVVNNNMAVAMQECYIEIMAAIGNVMPKRSRETRIRAAFRKMEKTAGTDIARTLMNLAADIGVDGYHTKT